MCLILTNLYPPPTKTDFIHVSGLCPVLLISSSKVLEAIHESSLKENVVASAFGCVVLEIKHWISGQVLDSFESLVAVHERFKASNDTNTDG